MRASTFGILVILGATFWFPQAALPYRIVLDTNFDFDDHEVHRSEEVLVNIVAVFDPDEELPASLDFEVRWDCVEDDLPGVDCVSSRGRTTQTPVNPAWPRLYGDVEETRCLALWCSCVAGMHLSAQRNDAPALHWTILATYRLSRQGTNEERGCIPWTYDINQFRTDDSTLTLIADHVAVDDLPWSHIKVLYRN